MAANYIESDPSKNARILQALRAIREGRAILNQELAVAVQSIDGDASLAAQFDVWTAMKGFVARDYPSADAAAKAGYDELSSLAFKLNRPAGQGDSTGAAIDQACAKFGV